MDHDNVQEKCSRQKEITGSTGNMTLAQSPRTAYTAT